MGWLASLALEDDVRQDLDLPRVVCDYEDIFSDELPRLPPWRDVDLCIELHLGTLPFLWCRLSCRNSRSNCRSCWTRVSLNRALHHGALRFYLLGKTSKFEWNDLCEKAFQELKRWLTIAAIMIVLEREQRYIVYWDASKDGLGCVLMQSGRVVAYGS